MQSNVVRRFGQLQVAYVFVEKMRRRGYRCSVYRDGHQVVVWAVCVRRWR
jgi:hypothetical protein